MGLRYVVAVFCAVSISAHGHALWADEVRIKNGDRITGTIVTMENKQLTVKTSYAGEVLIQWEQVDSIETDLPVHVVLGDKTSAHGVLMTTKTGELGLATPHVLEPLRFPVAQVEAVNPSTEPPVKLAGRVNAGTDVRKGNTDIETYHIEGELSARTEKNRGTVSAEANREVESQKKTAENWLLYTSYDHFLTRGWFFYTNANFEQDDFKDLNLRTTLGAGSGYQFFESEAVNLSVKGGLAYVNEDYSVDDDQDNYYKAGLWGVKYDQYFFEKLFQCFHHHEGTVSLENTQDIMIRTRTGLRIPLRKGFNTTVQYNWDWDNSPAPDNDRVDERYLVTLGYAWE